MLFCYCDLDFDPIDLLCELGLDIVKLYLYKKNKVSRSSLSTIRAQRGQTDRQTRLNTLTSAFTAGNYADFCRCVFSCVAHIYMNRLPKVVT